MKRFVLTAVLACFACLAQAQVSFPVKTNHDQEKAYGPAIEKAIVDPKSGDSVVIRVEVMLKKPIPMGCQYIYRVSNVSGDKTAKITSRKYAGQFQMKKEKLKPGDVVEFLVNTMDRCEGKSGYEKCIDCQPEFIITDIEIN